jgi:hypothetical protein
MLAKHFPKHRPVAARGFTKWIRPAVPKYFLGCCDCGLVHEFQFRTSHKDGLPEFRVRRANGYTKRHRKQWSHVCQPLLTKKQKISSKK